VSDPITAAARAAAKRLAADYGPGLLTDVQAELQARSTAPTRPDMFIDPVSVGSLIVTIATLAWTVYTDLRKKTPNPPPEAVARRVRVAFRELGDSQQPEASRITEVIVTEIIRTADDLR
jgi:hypothetical protein